MAKQNCRTCKLADDVATWTQVGDDIAGEIVCDNSGWSVASSAAGTRPAIGAVDNGDTNRGHVRVHGVGGCGLWYLFYGGCREV